MGSKHEIGDHTYLRKLSDFLNPLDPKVLPSNVDTSAWIPVIPYENGIENIDLFYVQVPQLELGYITDDEIFVEIGSDGDNFPLPPGYVYTLVRMEFFINMNALPAAGDQLTVLFQLRHPLWRLQDVSAAGVVQNTFTVSNRDLPWLNMRRTYPPMIELAVDSLTYSFTWPTGMYIAKGETELGLQQPAVEIYVPEGDTGSQLQFQVNYVDSAYAVKNFDAGANGRINALFKRRPIIESSYIQGGMSGPTS